MQLCCARNDLKHMQRIARVRKDYRDANAFQGKNLDRFRHGLLFGRTGSAYSLPLDCFVHPAGTLGDRFSVG